MSGPARMPTSKRERSKPTSTRCALFGFEIPYFFSKNLFEFYKKSIFFLCSCSLRRDIERASPHTEGIWPIWKWFSTITWIWSVRFPAAQTTNYLQMLSRCWGKIRAFFSKKFRPFLRSINQSIKQCGSWTTTQQINQSTVGLCYTV